MARTKQTARKSPGAQPPTRVPEVVQRSVLLQLMGFPREGDLSALEAPAEWSAVVDRLASHPQEAAIEEPHRLDTAPFNEMHGLDKYPLIIALTNQHNPITTQALEAFIKAFPDIVTKPRSTLMNVASKNEVLCEKRPEVINALVQANPHFSGLERSRTFQMMGYPRPYHEEPPMHHCNNYRRGGYAVNWQALERHLREHPEEARILCTTDDIAVPLFPLEAALHFQYPPAPLSTVRLLLELCPEAATISDSCALTTACCINDENADPEVVRAILRANPSLAENRGYYDCCKHTYEEQMGLPLHTLVYFNPSRAGEVALELIQAYPEALSDTSSVYTYTPLRVASEREKLSTDLLRILLEEGHRQKVGQESGLGQLFDMDYQCSDHPTAMQELIDRAMFEREYWHRGVGLRTWNNLCLGLQAAGAFRTGLAANAMWEYPLLQAAIEFGTRQVVVERLLERHFTPADLSRTDALGRTPLAVAIEMAGGNDNHDPEDIDFGAIVQLLLDDDARGSSQSANVLLHDTTIGTSCLPLHRALNHGVGLEDGSQHILDAFPGALSVPDPETNLLPCLLAAVGARARVNTIFGLMIVRPNLVATLCRSSSGGDPEVR